MHTEPELSPEVQAEVGGIVFDLRAAGWQITATRYDKRVFGNWFVDLQRNGRAIRLIKDRSQFMIDGQVDDLKAAGLFKAFKDLNAFREAVVAFAAPDRV